MTEIKYKTHCIFQVSWWASLKNGRNGPVNKYRFKQPVTADYAADFLRRAIVQAHAATGHVYRGEIKEIAP